jgi:hypothetical protein
MCPTLHAGPLSDGWGDNRRMHWRGWNGSITVQHDAIVLSRDDYAAARGGGLTGPPRSIPLRTISGVAWGEPAGAGLGWLTLGLDGRPAAALDVGRAAVHPDTVTFAAAQAQDFKDLYDWLREVVESNVRAGVEFGPSPLGNALPAPQATDMPGGIGANPTPGGPPSAADRLHAKARAEITSSLAAGEEIAVVITGASKQAIVGTDRRVFVYKKGFMAGATFGSELTSFDYRNLGGVQLHRGMMSGAVVLQGPGLSGASTNYWKNSDSDPFKAPNAIPLVRPFEPAEAGVAELRRLIADAHSGAHDQPVQSPPPQPAAAPASVADELQKLAALRDAGHLSAEEFQRLKDRLLG